MHVLKCVYVCLKNKKHTQKKPACVFTYVCRCVCVCVSMFLQHRLYMCVSAEGVYSCVSVSGLPAMIDPDSVSPCWRISVALNACYHGNRLPAYRSGTQTMVSLSFHVCCSTRCLPNFLSPHPPTSLSPIFPFFSVSCLDFHPFMSVVPLQGPPPPPFSLSLFSFSLTFLPLSIHSCQPRCHALTSLSPPLLSSSSPLVTSSSSSLFPFIHPCVYLCFISFNSPYLCLLFLSICSLLYFCVLVKHKHTEMLTDILSIIYIDNAEHN